MLQGRGLRVCWRPAPSWKSRRPRRQLQRCLQRMQLAQAEQQYAAELQKELAGGADAERDGR